MPLTATDPPRRHRLSTGDYYRMAEAGILRPDQRVELVDGEIIDVPPPGSRHAGTVDQLVEQLKDGIGDRAIIRSQNPVRMDDYSEPQPDVTLLRRRGDFYKSAHPRPEDILLIIEVAESSLSYDRDVKIPLYARHGVPEVWLIDLVGKRLVRCREPVEGEYRRQDEPGLEAALEIPGLGGVHVELGTVLFPDRGIKR